MPFNYFDAAIWAASTTFVTLLVLQTAVQENPAALDDLVLLAGLQILVYVSACALFAFRRKGQSFGELFALRPTSPWLLVLSLLLGVVLHGPAGTIGDLVERFAPMPPEIEQALRDKLSVKGHAHGVVLFSVVALAGPFVEELLYRGALYTALRPSSSAGSALFVTSLCFMLSHFEPRQWPAILVLACVLGFARAASGSMWSSACLHGAFNGTTLVLVLLARGREMEVPLAWEIGSWVVTLGLLGGFALWSKKSESARAARALDEPADRAPGELG